MLKYLFILLSLSLLSCSSHLLKYEEKEFEDHSEYQSELQVEVEKKEEKKEIKVESLPKEAPKIEKKEAKRKEKKKRAVIKAPTKDTSKKEKKTSEKAIHHPYQSGEKVVLMMTYFGMTAGKLVFEVLPQVKVNNEAAYEFRVSAETLKLFEMVYKVKNEVRTYVSKKTGLPFSYELDVNESNKIRQGRAIFDYNKNEVRYWEKLYREDKGLKKIKEVWPMDKVYQNAYSSLFRFRAFPFEDGKTYTLWVIHNKDPIKLEFKKIREEKIKTKAGVFSTIVVKPTLYEKGKKEEDTDVTFWLTNDERKMIVKIEADIKLGTLKGEVESLRR